MAKLSEIKLPNNVTYEFKDADAERALSETIRNTVSNQVELIETGEYNLGTMTIIISSDGFVTASGTTTDDITFRLTSALSTSGSKFFLMGGEGDSNTWWITLSDAGHNYTVYDTTPADVTTVSGGYINLHIKAGASIEANFAPILLKSSLYAMGVRYGQYAPTNRELYESMNSAQSVIDKMNIDAGSVTNPIYFADGVPTPCTYTVEKSVPSDAVFTDTTYESKSASSGGTALSLVTTGEKYTWNNKQSTFSSSNKLNPSYINYDSTHRAVTDTEKSTWNGKQNALTFDSAPTSGSTNPVTSGGVYTALSSKADSTEIHALETNITSSTTITAYVDALSKGHYATFFTSTSKPTDAPITDNCFVEIFVYSANTAYVRVTPTATAYIGSIYELNKISGTWETAWASHGYGMLIPDNTDINTITTIGDYYISSGTSAETMTNLPASALYSGHLIVSGLSAVNKTRVMQTYIPSWNATDKVGKIFVRHLINTAQWTDWIMISDNILMTGLVDRDGKNLLANDAGTKTVGSITFTMNDDRSITVSGTSRTSNSDYNICTNMPLKAGTYVLSGCPSGGNNSSTYKIQINGVGYDIGDSYEFTLSSDTTITVYIRIWSGYTPNNLVFKPMICTKSDWIVSKAYVPSAFSNLELTQLHTGIQLSGTVDLNDFKSIGTWYGFNAIGNSAAHLPVPNGNFNIRLEVIMLGATYIRQKCMIARIDNLYTEFIRGYNVSSSTPAWTEWQMMNVDGGIGWSLASGDDLNNLNTVGTYQATSYSISSTILNVPEAVQPFRLEVKALNSRINFVQELYTFNGLTYEPVVYRRVKTSAGWQSWIKITKDMPSTYELGTSLASNSDLNSLTTPGKWYATNTTIADTILNRPTSGVAFFGETIPSVAGSRYIQVLYPNDDTGDWYKRRYTGSWQKWIKYTGTPMS